MPVILTTSAEVDVWMNAPINEALSLHRPLADEVLRIVARGEKEDVGGARGGLICGIGAASALDLVRRRGF